MSNLPDRITDCTPGQMGDGNQFRIRPRADGKAWIAEVAWASIDLDLHDYDAEGFGNTVEHAMADAVGNLSSDELDDDDDYEG